MSVLNESSNSTKSETMTEEKSMEDESCLGVEKSPDREMIVDSPPGSGERVNNTDEMQCQDVSLDALSIEDKPQQSPKAPPKVKGRKIDLKPHEARRKLSASDTDEVTKVRKITPKVNCPEKIVLCIDISAELEEMSFQLGDGRKYSGLYMIKRIMEIFVRTKNFIDKQHEFALVIINETAVLLRNFTSDPRDICNVLEDLHETQPCDSCDLMSLFKNLFEKVTLPEIADPSVLPPPYLVRCILIYGRSNCIPLLDVENPILKKLQSSHYFFFDVLYIHRQPSSENKCQEVFQALCDIDQNYTSYIFEVGRNPTKLHNYMAMLLAHPLQRPPQNEARYKLKDKETEVTNKIPQQAVE